MGTNEHTTKSANPPRGKNLTRARMAVALVMAILADGTTMLLGFFGWTFLDEVIDVIAMIVTVCTLGFHFLLLPTFVLELFPLVDMAPTWTVCVLTVIALKKREQQQGGTAGPVKVEPPMLPPAAPSTTHAPSASKE